MNPSPGDPWASLARQAGRAPQPGGSRDAMPPGFDLRVLARLRASAHALPESEQDLLRLLRRAATACASVALLAAAITATTLPHASAANSSYAFADSLPHGSDDLLAAALFPD